MGTGNKMYRAERTVQRRLRICPKNTGQQQGFSQRKRKAEPTGELRNIGEKEKQFGKVEWDIRSQHTIET